MTSDKIPYSSPWGQFEAGHLVLIGGEIHKVLRINREGYMSDIGEEILSESMTSRPLYWWEKAWLWIKRHLPRIPE